MSSECLAQNETQTADPRPKEQAQTDDQGKTKNESILPPLQGFAKRDVKGTPVVPEWKMQAGYDEIFGTFYVGFIGLKLKAINNPPPVAVMGGEPLKHWQGHKPHPCVLKFIKLQDDTGGYYFQTVGAQDGPRGWIMPRPAEPHKARSWAIYFMQKTEKGPDS